MENVSLIQEMLPGYLSGDLSDKARAVIDGWRAESPENESIFIESLKAWDAISLLKEMEQFDSFGPHIADNMLTGDYQTESRGTFVGIKTAPLRPAQ